MSKPVITTRATKGSALTWTEGDTNLTNLRDATITVSDGTSSTAIDLNGTITFTAGSGISVDESSGTITISNTQSAGITDLVQDTTPQLGGTLDANGNTIDMGSNIITDTKVGNWDTAYSWGNHSVAGYLTSETYTGTVTSVAGTGTVNGLTLTGTVTSTGNLTLGGTLDLSSPPAIGGSAAAAVSATTLTFKDPREALYDLGTTGGTIAPNVANGSVQKITLNSALTINAFTSPQAGQSVTLIIYGGTSYTSITSTMKFAGGIKTLTGTAGCIDILSIYYDGTNYFASLNKGFA